MFLRISDWLKLIFKILICFNHPGNLLCTFCLDTKSTKKIKAAENFLKSALLYRKITRPAAAGLKQIFLYCFCKADFYTEIFRGRIESKDYHRTIEMILDQFEMLRTDISAG